MGAIAWEPLDEILIFLMSMPVFFLFFFPLQHAVSLLYRSFSLELSRKHSKLNFVHKYQAQW